MTLLVAILHFLLTSDSPTAMVVLIRKEEALELVQNAQVAFHWGLLPLVLYLGE